jgi:endonuclease/exonuclease/phosphatase (EEP) superfamily protein YafD
MSRSADEEKALAEAIVNQTNPTRPPEFKWQPSSFWQIWLGALSKTLYAFLGGYMWTIFGSLGLRWLGMESWPIVGFTNSILHLTTLFAFPALLLALIFRRLFLAAGLMIIAGVWIVWFGGHLLPKSVAPADPDAPRLTVMTYNLLYTNTDYDAMVATIQAADPDILLLQELDTPKAEMLMARLEYPHQALADGGVRGVGVLSRYPLLDVETLDLTFKHQRLLVDFDGDMSLVVYNVHPPTPFGPDGFSRRDAEVDLLYERAQADAERYDVIFAGDFNLTELAEKYALIRTHFDDAYSSVGQGLGWTYALAGRISLARIDYIFYAGGLRPLAVDVLDRSGSDHAPIYADFVFEAP